MSNNTGSLSSLFSDPITDRKTSIDSLCSTAANNNGAFMEVLNKYKNFDYNNRTESETKSQGLSEAIASLEANADIPAFDILSQDMDVLDLVNCSQKLLSSVSNTLEQLKLNDSAESKPNEIVDFSLSDTINDEQLKLLEVAAGSYDIILETNNQIKQSYESVNCSIKNKSVWKIPEMTIRRWAAEIVAALVHLHAKDIVCMDLHPDDILLGDKGHIQLTYFYRQEQKQLNVQAIEELNVAPERPLTKQSDWWSFGVILFELLTGQQFIVCHPAGISSYFELQYPENINLCAESKDLLKGVGYFGRVLFFF